MVNPPVDGVAIPAHAVHIRAGGYVLVAANAVRQVRPELLVVLHPLAYVPHNPVQNGLPSTAATLVFVVVVVVSVALLLASLLLLLASLLLPPVVATTAAAASISPTIAAFAHALLLGLLAGGVLGAWLCCSSLSQDNRLVQSGIDVQGVRLNRTLGVQHLDSLQFGADGTLHLLQFGSAAALEHAVGDILARILRNYTKNVYFSFEI